VCAACVRNGSRDKSNDDVANATVVTVVSTAGSGSPTRERKQKRTLAEIDARGSAAADEAEARSVAMRVRRGRAFKADFEPPTRRADTDATLVGPAL
jgi:hypothetical protein